MTKDTDRHSEPIHSPAHEPLTPEQRAPIEAENGFRQFDRLIKILERYLDGLRKENKEDFPVRPSMLMELNRIAVDKLISNPGGYRQTPMTIKSSAGVVKHEPPSWEDVPGWVDEMCDYVNQNWNKPALHLSAYLLWRVNWIHPFSDGNGRTARAISYLVLCVRLRQRLPGDRTMPEFISDEKSPYYAGLEVADEAYKKGTIDVSKLEAYLHELLMRQVTRAASTGDTAVARPTPPPKRDVDAIAEALGALTVVTANNAAGSRSTPWIAFAGAVIAAIIAGGVALSRCGKDARCIVGQQQPCRCPDGLSGIQTCDDDGLRFSACECRETADKIGSVGQRGSAIGSGSAIGGGAPKQGGSDSTKAAP